MYITKTHISFYNLKYEAKIVFLYLWQNRMLNKWIMHYILDGTCDNSRSKKNEFYELKSNDIEKNTIEQESFVSLIKVLRSSGVYSFSINRHMCEIENDKNLKAMASVHKVMLVLKNCNNLCRPELIIQ